MPTAVHACAHSYACAYSYLPVLRWAWSGLHAGHNPDKYMVFHIWQWYTMVLVMGLLLHLVMVRAQRGAAQGAAQHGCNGARVLDGNKGAAQDHHPCAHDVSAMSWGLLPHHHNTTCGGAVCTFPTSSSPLPVGRLCMHAYFHPRPASTCAHPWACPGDPAIWFSSVATGSQLWQKASPAADTADTTWLHSHCHCRQALGSAQSATFGIAHPVQHPHLTAGSGAGALAAAQHAQHAQHIRKAARAGGRAAGQAGRGPLRGGAPRRAT